MLVLLPPSEGKAPPPARGRPVAPAELSFPALTPLRERLLDALAATSARPDAASLLGVGPSLVPELERNTRLRTLPARPALEVYTGVLYDALDWATLSPGARRRAGTRVVVISALWGAVRPRDRIPPYRLSMDVDLPGIGPLARAWREVLDVELAAAAGPAGVIVDCRSSTYAAAWTPGPSLAARTVTVRVLREAPSGARTVVSHMAKHTRGEVARCLLESGVDPRTPTALAERLAAHLDGQLDRRWKVELEPPARPGRPWVLDVVLTS